MRFFNTEGPMKSDIHYTIPPLSRWNLEDILTLIARQKYFVVHAPRQTGKTSCLLALQACIAMWKSRKLRGNMSRTQCRRF